MQLTAAHYTERPEQRDKVTSSHRRMVSAGPSSSHSNCPQPATLCCRFPTLPAKRIPRGCFNPLESQAEETVTVLIAIPTVFAQRLGSIMQCHPSADMTNGMG